MVSKPDFLIELLTTGFQYEGKNWNSMSKYSKAIDKYLGMLFVLCAFVGLASYGYPLLIGISLHAADYPEENFFEFLSFLFKGSFIFFALPLAWLGIWLLPAVYFLSVSFQKIINKHKNAFILLWILFFVYLTRIMLGVGGVG